MKKTLTIVFMAILALLIFSGTVNAAGTKTVKVGDTFSVTVSLGTSVTSAGFDSVSWSADKITLNSNSLGKAVSNGGRFGFFGEVPYSSVTFNFTAVAEGTGTVAIRISEIGDTATDRIDTTTIIVKGEEPVATPTPAPVVNPTANNGNATKPTTSATKKITPKPTAKPTATPTPIATATPTNQSAPNELINIAGENIKKLEDIVTKVMIKALDIAIDDATQLSVTEIKKDSELYTKIENILKLIKGNKICYEIKLVKDNALIQPNGYVTVFIPIPENYSKDHLELYYVDLENGIYERIYGEVQGNYYSFTTNHFSKYVLVDKTINKAEENNQKTEQNVTSLPVVYVVIATVAIIIIGVCFIKLKAKTSKKGRRARS